MRINPPNNTKQTKRNSSSPLVMTLLVRDEADIVKTNIDYHLSRGVSYIIATDNASKDGTTEILEEFQKKHCLTLIHEPSTDYQQTPWVQRMMEIAKVKFGEAWIINNDADEFWRPPDRPDGTNGDLSVLLNSASSPIIACTRHNMVNCYTSLGSKPWYSNLIWRSLLDIAPPSGRELEKEPDYQPEHPLFCCSLPGKVVVHTKDLLGLSKGAHTATYSTDVEPQDLGIEIFHFPIRSREEFKISVERISDAVLRDINRVGLQSAKYVRWGKMLLEHGKIESSLAEALPSRAKFYKYRLLGQLVKDTRLKDDLESLQCV